MGPKYVRGGIYLFIRAIQEYRASKMILYQKVLDDTKLIINGPFKIHNLEPFRAIRCYSIGAPSAPAPSDLQPHYGNGVFININLLALDTTKN